MSCNTKLRDVADFQKGFAFKSKDYQDTGVKIVKVSNLTNDSIDLSQCVCIDNELSKKYNDKYELMSGDIIITTVGSWPTNPASVVGKVIKVPTDANNTLLNQNAVRVRSNSNINQRYLYYLLKNETFKEYIVGTAQGSANQASITQEDIKNFEFELHPLEEQEKIANILSSLDDKIELNNEMNKTLEEMAQSIFKRWFVNFEFPNEDGEPYKSSGGEMVDSALGMIPNGWEVKTLDDIGDIISGGTPSTKNEEYYGGYISWITPKDLSGYNRKFISKGERCITELGLQKSSAKLLPKGTVLFSSRAPIGYVAIAEKEVSTNQGFKSVVCNEEIMNNNYVYYFLKYNKENIENVSSGSTFKEISGTHMKNIKIIVPRKFILDKFNDIIESFDSLLKKNYEDMDVLEQIRDSLLPKLMTGDVNL